MLGLQLVSEAQQGPVLLHLERIARDACIRLRVLTKAELRVT